MSTSKADQAKAKTVQQQRIVFFHPDLGIGGAERLIVDAAVGLQDLGHTVTIFTSHCDPRHCFEEARDGKSALRRPPQTLSVDRSVMRRHSRRPSTRKYSFPFHSLKQVPHPACNPTPDTSHPRDLTFLQRAQESESHRLSGRPTLRLCAAPTMAVPLHSENTLLLSLP